MSEPISLQESPNWVLEWMRRWAHMPGEWRLVLLETGADGQFLVYSEPEPFLAEWSGTVHASFDNEPDAQAFFDEVEQRLLRGTP